MTERYYVSEIVGWLNVTEGRRSTRSRPGVSFTIHDRLNLCRPVWALRSEDVGSRDSRGLFAGEQDKPEARRRAEQRCRELNDA